MNPCTTCDDLNKECEYCTEREAWLFALVTDEFNRLEAER